MQNYSLLKRAGRVRQAGAAQARAWRPRSRAAADRRVHPGRGQPPRDPLRARRAQLRHRHAQPVRPDARSRWCTALSHLPIIADPSHGTGLRDKVTPMARAAVAAGADGLLVEVHPTSRSRALGRRPEPVSRAAVRPGRRGEPGPTRRAISCAGSRGLGKPPADRLGDDRVSRISCANCSGYSDCAPSDRARSGCGVHLDDDAVGAGGDRGARHRRHLVAEPGAVARVGDDRQVREACARSGSR